MLWRGHESGNLRAEMTALSAIASATSLARQENQDPAYAEAAGHSPSPTARATTLTATLFSGGRAALAHTGNSHASPLHSGRLRPIIECMRGKPAPGSRLLPKFGARRSAAITGTARGPAVRPPPPSCPMRLSGLAYHRRDNVPGQIRAQIGPLDHPPRSPRGQGPCDRNPSMQPNTVNNHHDTDPPVPPELLEAVARALAAALIPPPRRPPPPETEQAFGLPDRGAARPAARSLPGDSTAAGDRRSAAAHRGLPRHPENDPPVPAAVRRGVRGQRPGGRRPGRLRRRLAGAGDRARTVTAAPAATPHPSCAGAFCCALAGAGCVPRHRP